MTTHPDILAVIEGRSQWCVVTGDCLQILPTIPAGSVGAVVTDPPYGISGSSGTINVTKAKSVYANGLSDSVEEVRCVYVPAVKMALGLVPGGVGAVTPGTPHCTEYPKPDDIGAIVQPATTGMSKWGRATWQPVMFYGKDPRSGLTIQPMTFTNTQHPEQCGHPCTKPLLVMKWLVDRVSLPGSVVCDPFAGSGTTGVAAIQTGRRFIGIEIDEKYAAIARRRIADAAPLFVPPPAAPQPELYT